MHLAIIVSTVSNLLLLKLVAPTGVLQTMTLCQSWLVKGQHSASASLDTNSSKIIAQTIVGVTVNRDVKTVFFVLSKQFLCVCFCFVLWPFCQYSTRVLTV